MPDVPPTETELDDLRRELERLRLLHSIGQDFGSSLDFDALLPKVFDAVLSAVGAQGGSIWIAEGDVLRCRLAMGSASQKLIDTEVPIGTGFVGDVARKQRSTIVSNAIQDPRFQERVDRSTGMIATSVMAAPMVAKGVTVGSIQVTNKVTGEGIFDDNDRELLEGLAASAAVALRNAQLHTVEKRAHNLAVLLEISREITSTLDLDRVLQAVVNLASRALSFDQAAIGLNVKGQCEIRAIAGQETVDPKAEGTRRLAERGTWAMERGEPFYVVDVTAPTIDPERAFASAFGEGMETDGMRSGLYLPLGDEEGRLGVLMFESGQPHFAGEAQQEMAGVLANQTAVALRNAELYNQVPLVDVLGSLAEKKRKLMAMPKRRLQLTIGGAVVALAALTLIRWPLRVSGVAPTFRAASYAVVRPMVAGVVERVAVREGSAVQRGAPLLYLRAIDLQSDSAATASAALAAEQAAAAAAARGDAAGQRQAQTRARALERQLALVHEQLDATVLRAPVSGVVLTPRPEELVGAAPDAGTPLLLLGRTDTLELDLDVPQRDMERVALGQRVRLRVDALPQHTFEGRVTFLGELPVDSGSAVTFPVRAAIPNPDGALRPGMVAHAKVLTAPMSVAGRLLRGPVRWVRLLWWRLFG